jgi:hypothetical protein
MLRIVTLLILHCYPVICDIYRGRHLSACARSGNYEIPVLYNYNYIYLGCSDPGSIWAVQILGNLTGLPSWDSLSFTLYQGS